MNSLVPSACAGICGCYQCCRHAINKFNPADKHVLSCRWTEASGQVIQGLRIAGPQAIGMQSLILKNTNCGMQVLYEPAKDTVCLLGWSKNILVLTFRGTASMANVWADLSVSCCCCLIYGAPDPLRISAYPGWKCCQHF